MDTKFTNENFENFLQQNAEDFRMNPSPKVWDNISKDLNKKRRKYYIGFFALVVSSALIGYSVWDPSLPYLASSQRKEKSSSAPSTPAKKEIPGQASIKILQPKLKPSEKKKQPGIVVNMHAAKPVGTGADNTPNTAAQITTHTTVNERKAAPVANLSLSEQLSQLTILQKQRMAFTEGLQTNTTESTESKPALLSHCKTSRFGFMFFFTPTISYRKLSENKSYLRGSTPAIVPASYSALYDINNAVTHKPDIGLEFGLTSKYALTRNIKLRAGLQFNISRYDIKAFTYVPEVATIALNSSRGVDSLNTVSNYRNFNGGTTDWLQNFYFQISAPIGAEIKIRGNDKMYFGVASTFQPTYVLGDRAYLITVDYKNYAQVPWLMRRWNVNTNLETFVAYSTGKLKWQVGPQVRYQLLSSFITEYPVKENLFDYGLKVGISLNQKQKSQ